MSCSAVSTHRRAGSDRALRLVVLGLALVLAAACSGSSAPTVAPPVFESTICPPDPPGVVTDYTAMDVAMMQGPPTFRWFEVPDMRALSIGPAGADGRRTIDLGPGAVPLSSAEPAGLLVLRPSSDERGRLQPGEGTVFVQVTVDGFVALAVVVRPDDHAFIVAECLPYGWASGMSTAAKVMQIGPAELMRRIARGDPQVAVELRKVARPGATS